MTDVVRLTFPVEVVVVETAPVDVDAIVGEAVSRIETALSARRR